MITRAAYMKAPWQCEVRSVELPDTPPAGWALIAVEACGICGSDLIAAAHNATEWQAWGHEISGVIDLMGSEASHLKPGVKVVLESASFCGFCSHCRDGRVDLCNKAPHFGHQKAMGMSQYMLAPLCCVVPYEGLSPEAACLTEPAGVAYDMVKVADIRLGDRVCVVGPGPIGLMAVSLALASGAERVLCVGKPTNVRRLKVAQELGAETLAYEGPLTELNDLGRAFDHVLVTAPPPAIPPALSLLTYGGVLTFIGLGRGGSRNITIDADDFHCRKLQLRSSFASPAVYFPSTLRLLRNGAIQADKIISHVFALEDVPKAIEMCRCQRNETLKVIVRPSRDLA